MANIWLILCVIVSCVTVNGEMSLSDHIGHLRPLGNQHPPTVLIDEFTPETAPKPNDFYRNYIKPSKAAIFRNAMLETKAFEIWDDDYLKYHYGDLEVRLEGKKEKVHATPIGEKYIGRDTIKHFVETYHSPNSSSYIVSELPKQMYGDVGILPSLGACSDMTKSFVEIDLWWSGGGSKSVIHKDAFNQINCLYRGKKHWKLFEFKYEKWLYKHYENDFEVGGFSDINVDAVDLVKHPDFLKVPWSNFTLNPGDCLFLPKSYYHQVDSDGPFNLAVSILFSRFDRTKPKNFSDCTPHTDYIIPRPLNEVPVMWQWSGKGVMSMGYGDVEECYRYPLIKAVKILNKKDQKMTFDVLRKMFDDLAADGRKTMQNKMKEAFDAIDLSKDGIVTIEELQNATLDDMVRYGSAIEPYEPSNTYEFEYSFISLQSVYNLLKTIFQSKDHLTREEWIKHYVHNLLGTSTFANEIFTGLVQSSTIDSLETKNITEEDIERAVANWKRFYAPQYDTDSDAENYTPFVDQYGLWNESEVDDEDDDGDVEDDDDVEDKDDVLIESYDGDNSQFTLKEEL